MFTGPEKRLLSEDYFILLREEEQYFEIESKNTKHCWRVFKNKSKNGKPVDLYHKHKISDPWYHKHFQTITVKEAIKNIKEHDEFVLQNPGYLEKKD